MSASLHYTALTIKERTDRLIISPREELRRFWQSQMLRCMLIPMTPQEATAFEFTARTYIPETNETSFTYRVHFADARSLEFTETISLGVDAAVSALPDTLIATKLEDLHLVLGISK
jgi:hypothetical protein